MARKKPYKKSTMWIDIILLILTFGMWGFVMIPRELFQRS